MIFGFNTDIKHDDTVYHVQSEAREGEMLLQTQVFVRGRCIGKRATSYAEQASSAGFTDQRKEQILRQQHRLVLDAIRDGHLEQVFDKRETPETLAAEKELDIQWLNSEVRPLPRQTLDEVARHRSRPGNRRSPPDRPLCPRQRRPVLHPGHDECLRRC